MRLLRLKAVDCPPGPVEALVGRAYTTADGERRVEYMTAAGERFVCVTDEAFRQWYAVVDVTEVPEGESP